MVDKGDSAASDGDLEWNVHKNDATLTVRSWKGVWFWTFEDWLVVGV